MNEIFSMLQWREPLWLLLALQPILLWLALRWLKNRNQQHFADDDLLPWIEVQNNRTWVQKLLSRDTAYSLAWLGFALALAGPRIPQKDNPDPNYIILDVMLVFDLSDSMKATDIKPSRLRRATLEAYEFLSKVKSARIGVVIYAARPHLYVPLSNDLKALEYYLKDLDSLQLPTQGSDSAAALEFALKELARSNTPNHQQNIIWFTDGDFTENEISQIDEVLKTGQIKPYIIGLGLNEGSEIPLSDGSWLTSNGQHVISKANFELLEKTAQKWEGVFSAAMDDEADWQKLYQKGILANLEANPAQDTKNWQELYDWFLWPAILLLLIALFPLFKALLFLIFVSVMISLSTTANAEESYIEKILQGASGYDSEEYNFAKVDFIQATLDATTDSQRAIALHNLGNTLFKIGDYENAIYLFTDALSYNPDQAQSLHNQKLTLELYKLLQKRQEKVRLRGSVGLPDQQPNTFDFPQQIALMLETKIHTMEFNLPELPKDEMNRLLEKGLAHLQLLESEQQKNNSKKLQQQKVNEARIYLNELAEQNSGSSAAMWKRLFEVEEGFPGSLDKPETVPGIRPW